MHPPGHPRRSLSTSVTGLFISFSIPLAANFAVHHGEMLIQAERSSSIHHIDHK